MQPITDASGFYETVMVENYNLNNKKFNEKY